MIMIIAATFITKLPESGVMGNTITELGVAEDHLSLQ